MLPAVPSANFQRLPSERRYWVANWLVQLPCAVHAASRVFMPWSSGPTILPVFVVADPEYSGALAAEQREPSPRAVRKSLPLLDPSGSWSPRKLPEAESDVFMTVGLFRITPLDPHT